MSIRYIDGYKKKRVERYADIATFVKLLTTRGRGDKTYCEQYDGKTIVKPFYDWDRYVDEEDEIRQFKEREQDAFELCLDKLHPGDTEILYADRSGYNGEKKVWKISLRAFVQKVKISVEDIALLITNVLGKDTQSLDCDIYKAGTRSLNCVYCHKTTSDKRVLLPRDETDVNDVEAVRAYVIQDVEDCELLTVARPMEASVAPLVKRPRLDVSAHPLLVDPLVKWLCAEFPLAQTGVRLEKMTYNPKYDNVEIPTDSLACPFKKETHQSNHLYLVAKMRDYVELRCHDGKCSKSSERRGWGRIPDDASSILEDHIKRILPGTVAPATLGPLVPLNKIFQLPSDVEWSYEQKKRGYHLHPGSKPCLVSREDHGKQDHSWVLIQQDQKVLTVCMTCGEKKVKAKEAKVIYQQFNQLVLQVFEGEDKRTFEYLVKKLRESAESQHLRRGKGAGTVYAPVAGLPYAYVMQWDDPADFVNEILFDDERYHDSAQNHRNLVEWMKSYQHLSFPFIRRNRDLFGFRNGVLDIRTQTFIDKEVYESDQGTVVRKYFDIDFRGEEATPLFDKLLNAQFSQHEGVADFLCMCIGRLLFEVGDLDDWQFMPYLMGVSNTGKSTIMSIVAAMFESDTVGAIAKNFEEKFGLEGLYTKEIILIDDLPASIKDTFDQTVFQSCITGGKVPVSRKNDKAGKVVDWKVPFMWGGNWYMDYVDQGQVTRRVAVFEFTEVTLRRDPQLRKKILSGELGSVIAKCLRMYHTQVAQNGDKVVWDFCPSYFRDRRDDQRQAQNAFYAFLTSSPRFQYVEHAVTAIDAIREAYAESENSRPKDFAYSVFQEIHPEWRVRERKNCVYCGTHHRKGCCARYTSASFGRRNYRWVDNMFMSPARI